MRVNGESERAFSLLETVLGIAITAIAASAITVSLVHVGSVLTLESTATSITYRLRDIQEMARTQGIYTQARMSMYTPSYQIFQGTKMLRQASFGAGVHYHDGYLQMPSGNFLYDIQGNAQMAGTLRLVDVGMEQDITFYMGTGCNGLGSVRRESP